MKIVNVAVGVIVDGERILLSLRNQAQHQGGKWEFPGGKIEDGELVVDALSRELEEELLIVVDKDSCKPLIRVEHDYGDKKVCLHVYTLTRYSGEPQGAEQQEIRWVNRNELVDLNFPEANEVILEEILKSGFSAD
ncbi:MULTISPECIES: 8-oxo-dGTP diphosphatase MutT [unclassified Agarivorans]|uniref:8-oxo-dGTP diphosphatase MutT n=1 Tax=unclassified Agarivorans TaxID=2636026 RepID=UPI0026E1626A|nr:MULTISPECIES: 8-oxo-dGTP diphosphatase MutT [unclassified Agarivorans]MDO6686920.1 8-oxo-dGTP diphosphatase MutT [Agarivorans sp. 3_MG-2023]MDO6716717.1 8-oxo-dGTP diphosphatase MutT [Agarivorans sp. 2_MG-2023]MDO6764544.1 8-oxo-dGTP diphosphatase MutT [Agarivorans sp. 1_MG-2023]